MDVKEDLAQVEEKYNRFMGPKEPERFILIEDLFPYLRKDYIPPSYIPQLDIPGLPKIPEKKYYKKIPWDLFNHEPKLNQ